MNVLYYACFILNFFMQINSKHVFWFLLILCLLAFSYRVYAEITEDRPTDENIGIAWNHFWIDLRWKNLKEWKLEDHKPKEVTKVAPKSIIKAQIKPVETRKEEKPTNDIFDVKKLAYAVAVAETWDCAKGYWKTHSNCHGIKKGNTYPCTTRPWSKMCVFKDKAESYKAFEIIWMKWYKTFPTHRQAVIWSGNDSSDTWLKHVKIAYSK